MKPVILVSINKYPIFSSPVFLDILHKFAFIGDDTKFIKVFQAISYTINEWYFSAAKNNKFKKKTLIYDLPVLSEKDSFYFFLFLLHVKIYYKENFAGFLRNDYIKTDFLLEEQRALESLDIFISDFILYCQRNKVFSGWRAILINTFFFFSHITFATNILDFTIKNQGAFATWFNMNIKLIPLTLLLFLSTIIFPTLPVFYPLSLIFPQAIFINLIIIFILTVYISRVYAGFFFKEILYLYQAIFFIKNPWIFFIHSIKFVFLLLCSFFCLKFFIFELRKINPNLIFLGILLFSNLRLLFMFTIGKIIYQIFRPLSREITRFFETRRKKELKKNLLDHLTREANTIQDIYEEKKMLDYLFVDIEYYEHNFISSFLLFWLFLLPYHIFQFFLPYVNLMFQKVKNLTFCKIYKNYK